MEIETQPLKKELIIWVQDLMDFLMLSGYLIAYMPYFLFEIQFSDHNILPWN